MVKKGILFFLFILTIFHVNASIRDSVAFYLKHSKPSLIGGFSSRSTFIGVNNTSVAGISLGYDYGGKVKLTAGVYFLSKPLVERRTINAFTPLEMRIDEKSRFWYVGLTGDYVFYKKGRWTLNVPFRIGMGSARVRQYDIFTKALLNKKTSMIVPLETGVGALYKLTWWVGLGGGIGSRVVLGKNNSQRFSGTYYNLGVTLFFGEIYQHMAKRMNRDPLKDLEKKINLKSLRK